MSRIRKYECPECMEYTVLPKGKTKYVCSKCNKSFSDKEIDKTSWKDSSGDIIAEDDPTKLDAATATLELSIMIQSQADQIVALIPQATRHLYPDDPKEAALKFYMEHKDFFK